MQFFERITATPKKRAATLFVLGCCATLALPPFFLFPFLAVSSCGWLLLLLRAQTLGQAFRTGWWWGLGFFVSGLYWVCISLTVDIEKFGWMIPFALFGLNGLIAIFPALASLGFFYFYHKPGKISDNTGASDQRNILVAVCMFSICWSASEFARSTILTGFPWNLIGYAWGNYAAGMQVTSILGIHGLTLATMLLSFIPLLYIRHNKKAALRIGFIWMLMLAWGMWRLDYPAEEHAKQNASQPIIRVVQAAIPQSLKWDPVARNFGIAKHMEMTRKAQGKADIIVWPESAVPLPINQEPALERDLRALLNDDQLLITGSIQVSDTLAGTIPIIHNSVYTLSKDAVLHIYDKHHLVPFGEFVPLRTVLPLDKITPGSIDYSSGPGPLTVQATKDSPAFSPLVCYEAIFSGGIIGEHQKRPDWLVNVTNDAWFGNSTGPYQHLHMTRFRAVEQGLPLVRAANTGISAVIDPYGRILDRIELNQSGTINVPLPRPLPATIFSYVGNWLYLIMIAGLAAITLSCRPRQHLK